MSPRNFKPGSPEDWLARAKSNLIKARNIPCDPDFLLEDACFDAQQAAEKAVKAVLAHMGIKFPYIHNLTELLDLLLRHGHMGFPMMSYKQGD